MIIYVFFYSSFLYDIIIRMLCVKQEFENVNATVSESNFVAFLTKMSRTGNINIKNRLPDDSAKRQGEEFLAECAKAVGAIQTVQAGELGNKNLLDHSTLI